MNLRKYLLAALLFLCVGCAHETPEFSEAQETEMLPVQSINPEINIAPKVIALQNLRSRILVYCYEVIGGHAEECAQKFESEGYVRLKDIPRQPAQYDFLQDGTYPTRRWRDDELIPRW